jgi:hypothetical protein
MKNALFNVGRALTVVAGGALLLSGCVGYNHTLFMTKSNAGLDIDTTPPTAEINISRKEGVVAPAFEDGQTPPVMASFGSNIGAGASIGRFFFGVDQTFAGGDAAVTMATLYSDPTPKPATAADEAVLKTKFDSALKLSKIPNDNINSGGLKRFLFGLPEPGETRPFIFGTDTQFGLKLGWNGIGGPYPDTLKIGFNRKEFAYAPVTLTRDSSGNPNKPHLVEMPSFLATVDNDAHGGGDASVNWIQYFATGEAANQLARQDTVRAAMLKRADPAQGPDIDAAIAHNREVAAQGRIDVRLKQVDDIIAKVIAADNMTIDKAKLATIAAGISGLDTAWVDSFGGQPSETLRKRLRNIDKDSVPALHSNLAKI